MVSQLHALLVTLASCTASGSIHTYSDTSPENLVLLQLNASVLEGSRNKTAPSNSSHRECEKAGLIYFAHVMKDGGSSVDGFLNCLCKQERCSVKHVENVASKELIGHQRCEASICSSHGAVLNRGNEDNCGTKFQDSKVFTVLRDPVSRVFSFYVYMRYKKQDPYFQQPLIDMLHNYKGCYNDQDWFICAEFNNSMVGKYFVNNVVLELNGVSEESILSNTAATLVTPSALKQAQELLSSFDAVFFIEDFGRFPYLYHKSGLPFADAAARCELPELNDNLCEECEPTEEERALIEELNWADIELFNTAKNRGNRMR